jgi:hypothetical protein
MTCLRRQSKSKMQTQAPKCTTEELSSQIDPKNTPSALRHKWLESIAAGLHPRFHGAGYSIPGNVRISLGFPRPGADKDPLGKIWPAELSTDGFFEIFISPEGHDTIEIIGVVAHEPVHAAVGLKAGHRRAFKKCANAIGLIGRMRSTTESAELRAWMYSVLISKYGEYPSGRIVREDTVKTPRKRSIRCTCTTCDYVASVPIKCFQQYGAPLCPRHGLMIPELAEALPDEAIPGQTLLFDDAGRVSEEANQLAAECLPSRQD